MKAPLDNIIEEEKLSLSQLSGFVSIQFTQKVNERIEHHKDIIDRLLNRKQQRATEQSRYTSPLPPHYFEQIFFKS